MSNKRVNPFKLKLHLLECEADEKDKKISDLETKLAESEEQLIAMNEKSNKIKKESFYLKQQLANKDKELKQLKLDLGMFKSVNEFLNRYGVEKAREVLLQTEKTKRQDKISFAVDILEELAGCSNYINSKLDFECSSYVSEKAIRDKIKYLKGKKDE